jgi:hypothetical protein
MGIRQQLTQYLPSEVGFDEEATAASDVWHDLDIAANQALEDLGNAICETFDCRARSI